MRMKVARFMAVAVCILSSCARPTSKPQFDANGVAVETIVSRLRDCPSPLDIAESDDALRRQVLRALQSICVYDVETVRKAESAYLETNPSPLDETKLYVLHRCLFDVPERTGSDMPVFAAWGEAHDTKGYRMM